MQTRWNYLVITLFPLLLLGCPVERPDETLDDLGHDWDGDGYCETAPCLEDAEGGDCNDGDPNVHPGADEGCDGLDTDCDGSLGSTEVDGDGDAYMVCQGDCNDEDPDVHPGADEQCNGHDDDCDGSPDAEEVDADGDGVMVCSNDCNDGDDEVFPGAEEVCNGIDDDCDGDVDEGHDADGDGFTTCGADGVLDTEDDDCDDGDANVHEVCMLLVPSGTFTMGSSVDEVGHHAGEDLHEVELTHAFYVGVTEVTQSEFEAIVGWNPSDCGYGCGDDYPVQQISWYDAVAFANEVSAVWGLEPCYSVFDVMCEDGTVVGVDYMACMNGSQAGIDSAEVALNESATPYECDGFRLLTEAEWEYAARAGEAAAFHNGGNLNPGDEEDCTGNLLLDDSSYLDDIAWYCGNDTGSSEPVGGLEPNNWGLFDMSGNVWEWVGDWWGDYEGDAIDPTGPESGSHRVYRGGSWDNVPEIVRSANHHNSNDPDFDDPRVGLRLARSNPE